MRILSKKTFLFTAPGVESKVRVEANQITDVPDWITKTLLYRLATKDDVISVLASPASVAAAEKEIADEESRHGKLKAGK
jgi:hypothetical protein